MKWVGFFIHIATHFFQSRCELHVSLNALRVDAVEGHLSAGHCCRRQKIRGARPVAFHLVSLGFIVVSCFNFEMLITLIFNMDTEGLHDVQSDVGIRFWSEVPLYMDAGIIFKIRSRK